MLNLKLEKLDIPLYLDIMKTSVYNNDFWKSY